MQIKGFGINIDKSKRLWVIISIALFVAIALISTSFILIFKVSDNGSVNKLSDLFNTKSYYAEYVLKVVSNKNENEYKIKEWYVKDEKGYKFRIETDNKENNFIYLGNQNSISIKSDEQINSLNLQNYNLKRNNVISISTFMELLFELNLSIENGNYIENKCCKIEEIEEDQILKFMVSLNGKCVDGCKCNICNKFTETGMKISKFELILNKEKIIPMQYIIYDTNEEIYIDIRYEKFSVNSEFDEKIFAFLYK